MDSYTRQQEAIRKAKGNPNKNIHHKKNNSNYGGGDYQREKTAQAAKKPEKPGNRKGQAAPVAEDHLGCDVRRTGGSADPADDSV